MKKPFLKFSDNFSDNYSILTTRWPELVYTVVGCTSQKWVVHINEPNLDQEITYLSRFAVPPLAANDWGAYQSIVRRHKSFSFAS